MSWGTRAYYFCYLHILSIGKVSASSCGLPPQMDFVQDTPRAPCSPSHGCSLQLFCRARRPKMAHVGVSDRIAFADLYGLHE